MNPGKLRHRITIQQRSSEQDGYGGQIDTWDDVATVWASVEPLTGRALFAAQELNSEVTIKITMRYRAGITYAMRVAYGTRTFDILAPIDPEERHIELHLMCKEMIPNG